MPLRAARKLTASRHIKYFLSRGPVSRPRRRCEGKSPHRFARVSPNSDRESARGGPGAPADGCDRMPA